MFDLYRSRGQAPDHSIDPSLTSLDTDRIRKWIVGGDLFLLVAVALGVIANFASASTAKTISSVLGLLGLAFIIFIVARVIALSGPGSKGRMGGKLSLGLSPTDTKEKP